MKENKGRFPWERWATHETVDKDGQVWQFNEPPFFDQVDQTWDLYNAACSINGNCKKVGRSHPPEDAAKTLIERYPSDQSETAPAETDAPDLQARVEALEAHKIQSDADFKKLYVSVIDLVKQSRSDAALIADLVTRVGSLSSDVAWLREIQDEEHAGVISFDELRTFLDETPAEPDQTAKIAEIEQNERLLPIKQFPWTIEYKSTPIDPTGQKIDALKLLFPWRDGCNFMTVDAKFGMIWQWGNEPVNDSKTWASKGGDANARRVGHIPDPDPELCKILIKRNDGE